MLEDHLKSNAICRRLRAGAASRHVDAFTDWMHREGYRPRCIYELCRQLAVWTDWMLGAGMDGNLPAGLAAYKQMLSMGGRLLNAARKPHKSVSAASVFVRFLVSHGLITVPPPRSPLDTWPLLRQFHDWEHQHRGLTDSTLKLYERVVADLLGCLGDDPKAYTAATVRTFVLEHSRPHSRHRVATIITAVRAFLRFLGATGRCRSGLEYSIPAIASWRQSAVVQHLSADEVQRVIDACPTDGTSGLRTRAVILLLARLGLRGGDVRNLSFADLDCRNGRVALCGKTRRQEWLPLPQEVGDALAAYLVKGRPKVKMPQVFLTIYAPFRPLAKGSVGNIARSALRRAGVETPRPGAHIFRHSAATTMLRQGVSLAGIGAVLRHRSPTTTMQYAKVDTELLSAVAQPWPVVFPC